MGWSIIIKTNKPLTEAVVEEVIADLPKTIKRDYSKQAWGWITGVDVSLDSPNKLRLSGSYGQSGEIAEGAAEAFSRRLEKRGFEVTYNALE